MKSDERWYYDVLVLIDVYLKKEKVENVYARREEIIQTAQFILFIDIFNSMDYLNS